MTRIDDRQHHPAKRSRHHKPASPPSAPTDRRSSSSRPACLGEFAREGTSPARQLLNPTETTTPAAPAAHHPAKCVTRAATASARPPSTPAPTTARRFKPRVCQSRIALLRRPQPPRVRSRHQHHHRRRSSDRSATGHRCPAAREPPKISSSVLSPAPPCTPTHHTATPSSSRASLSNGSRSAPPGRSTPARPATATMRLGANPQPDPDPLPARFHQFR